MAIKSIFITGATGYIGGAIVAEIVQNHSDEYNVTALVRTDAAAQKLKELGVTPVLGGYDKPEILVNAAKNFDIIIHTGDSADNVESAKAIAQGIKERPASQAPIVYIHTSGTAVIGDTAGGNHEEQHIYSELKPEEIDALDENQPHRKVDIFVRNNAKASESEGKVKTAIIIPPNIYGIGKGPINTISIQTPALIQSALKTRFVPQIGQGINWWNNVHISDLARGYVILLKELEKRDGSWQRYWFSELGEHQAKDLYATLAKVMHSKGLADQAEPQNPSKVLGSKTDVAGLYESLGRETGPDFWGSNSRGRADGLRALGWKKQEAGVLEVIPDEVDAVLAKIAAAKAKAM